MIVLDTNLLSEALKPAPSATPLRWLAAQEPRSVYLTIITVAELLYGIQILPGGKRRDSLARAVADILLNDFQGRILPFDTDSAQHYAIIAATRRKQGRPISQSDAMLAAICRSHRATLATRNTPDFDSCGIALIDPWSHQTEV